jgi:tetratricopeptide (TPR) repeat protein
MPVAQHRFPRRPTTLLLALVGLLAMAAMLAMPAMAAKVAIMEGTVLDEAGAPVEGVTVTVSSPDRPDWRETARSDAEGHFALEISRPKGGFLYQLSKEGYDPQVGAVELVAGQRTTFDFVLETPDGELARKRRAIAVYNRGAAAFNADENTAAMTAFQEALELDPNLVEAHRALAEVALKVDDPTALATAAAAAAAVRRLAPDDPEGVRLAFAAALRGEDREALEAAALALPEDRRLAAARLIYNRGAEASQKQRLDEALAYFALAVRLDPTLAAGHSALASTFYNAGRFEEALAAAERFLELAPEDLPGLRLRALAASATGDEERATTALQALAAVDPEAAVSAILTQARDLFQSGQISAAEREANRALGLVPDHPEALYTLALVAVNQGETARAKTLFQKIVDTAPDSPRAAEAKNMLQYL